MKQVYIVNSAPIADAVTVIAMFAAFTVMYVSFAAYIAFETYNENAAKQRK